MLPDLRRFLNEYSQSADALLIIGVSGGPDSLSLLHSLQRLGCRLIAAHLDHALRSESAADAELVRRTAAEWDIPVVVERRDAAAYARENNLSIEEAAREVRYRFLFGLAKERRAQAVAVAHTADDQVETALMHLLRGAGLSGLAGMAFRSLPNPWSDTIPLLRPLLGTWRSAIEAYVIENDLHPVQDVTNLDTRFYRNRLRHETLPYLETLNPGFRKRLWQTAALLRDEDVLLAQLADSAWNSSFLPLPLEEGRQNNPPLPLGEGRGEGIIALNALLLRSYPVAIQCRVLRQAIARLRPGLRDIDYAAVQRAVDFLKTPTATRQADLSAGLRLVMDGERLWLAEWDATLPAGGVPQLPAGAEPALAVPGKIALPGGWQLSAGVYDLTPELYKQATANTDHYHAWLDLDALTLPLTVRTRRSGDRFRPLGMGGRSQKLSDFMINNGMPKTARDGWPLVVSEEEIAWVPGYRIGERFALREESRKATKLNLHQTPPGEFHI